MEIGERIKLVRQASGKTQQAFADIIGLKRNTIANYEIGQVKPSDRTIMDICREFGVSERWLRTGEGDMMIPKEPDAQLDEILGQIASSEDELIKKIIKAYWALDDKEKAAIRKLIDGLCEK